MKLVNVTLHITNICHTRPSVSMSQEFVLFLLLLLFHFPNVSEENSLFDIVLILDERFAIPSSSPRIYQHWKSLANFFTDNFAIDESPLSQNQIQICEMPYLLGFPHEHCGGINKEIFANDSNEFEGKLNGKYVIDEYRNATRVVVGKLCFCNNLYSMSANVS